MSIAGPWAAGDTLEVDTRAGQRGIWKKVAGSTIRTSILGKLSGASPWLQLHGLNNRLWINNAAFDFAGQGFGHTVTYWGV